MRQTLYIAACWMLAGWMLADTGSAAQAAAPDKVQIQSWLAQLDDEDFVRREEATQRLHAAGEASIEALAKGALSSSPETAWRAGEALKRIAISGNEQTLERVATALEQVGVQGRNSTRQVVAEIRARQRQMRHDVAAAQIRKLGGGLVGPGSGLSDEMGIDVGFMMPPMIAIDVVSEIVAIDVVPAEVAEEAARVEATAEAIKDLPKPEAAKLEEVVKELFPAALAEAPEPAEDKPADVEAAAEARDVVRRAVAVLDEVLGKAIAPAADAKAAEPAAEEPAAEGPGAAEIVEERLIGFGGDVAVAMAVVEGGGLMLGGDVDLTTTLSAAESLSLGPQWRGGDKGLAVLRDLPEIAAVSIQGAKLTDAALAHVAALPNLRSINIRGTKFSAAALRKLHRARPSAYMFCQGEAMVGIHADTTGSCVLTSVYPGSGAFDAGLRAGDKIVAIDDLEVRDFSELTISVYARGVGEKLKIEFERDGKRQTAQVELRARKVLEP